MARIIYGDKTYPIKELDLPEVGPVYIGTETLLNDLEDDEGAWIMDEARQVDEQIYFYIQDECIHLPDEKLIDILIEETY